MIDCTYQLSQLRLLTSRATNDCKISFAILIAEVCAVARQK